MNHNVAPFTMNYMSVNQDRTLSSMRLTLEPIQGRHSELLFDVLQDTSIYTYIPTEPPTSKAALRARYEWLAQRQSPDGSEVWLNWAIRLRLYRYGAGHDPCRCRCAVGL
jgi:hypothetical protein